MAVGQQITKADLDQRFGSQSLIVLQVMGQWIALKKTVDGLADGDLTTLGYSSADITLIRAALTDTGTIVSIFTGQATLSVAYDFTQHIAKMAGLGF